MELKIPVEIVFDDVNSVIDELGKLQKYKLGEGDDTTLVNVDDVADILTRHVKAREAKEPSIDAVPVIRCKDCKYYKENTLVCGRYGLEDDDYCSWAERREE